MSKIELMGKQYEAYLTGWDAALRRAAMEIGDRDLSAWEAREIILGLQRKQETEE
jgi:hypothetical protein